MRHISNKKGKCAHSFKERALDAKQTINFFCLTTWSLAINFVMAVPSKSYETNYIYHGLSSSGCIFATEKSVGKRRRN